jgi:hypothetical protein
MSDDKFDYQTRISMQSIAEDEGDWISAPKEDDSLLRTAIFESLFNYICMVTESKSMSLQFDTLDSVAMMNALVMRTELEVLDALLKSYEKRYKKQE